MTKKYTKKKRFGPFFKCPGGKRRLVPELRKNLPPNFFSSNYLYIEPFVGGGALALSLLNENPNQKITINDANAHIINLWKALTYEPAELMDHYEKFLYSDLTKERYTEIRDQLPGLTSSRLSTYEYSYSVYIAAHFLFLNKNCFNGLIRFNKKGKFNSPLGQYRHIQTYNEENILKVSEALNKIHFNMYSLDFQSFMEKVELKNNKNILFYFDPPYVPLSKTSNFTGYLSNGFSTYDQFRLKTTIDYLNFLDIKFILSNSNTDLVKSLYSQYNIREIQASRVINSKGNKRGKIPEYIITNY